ncbi:PREDICTED: phospholipid phosphatase 1 [Myotis davidii]|uniref:phospholipid phosphatase 1 n=1 Tax=Myotis davidii TaxID=225400 RepID=UPI000766E785|nr:PREDICTED: phospholipid phosphatase 1 [Myotis davidii]
MWPLQHRVIANSDVTLTRRILKKCLWLRNPRRSVPSHSLPHSTAKMLVLWTCYVCCWISLGEMIHVQGLQLSSPAFMSSTYKAMIYRQPGIFGPRLTLASWSQTDIAKMTTGHLRPHFLAVCLPNRVSLDCKIGYITNQAS